MEKQTKDEAIDLVKNSFPTIFSKEDVIKVLESVNAGELTIEEKTKLAEDLKEELKDDDDFIAECIESKKDEIIDEYRDKIKNQIDQAVSGVRWDDHIDRDNAEFSLDGKEIQLDSVGMDESSIASEITDAIDWDA
jgi:polyhydroxyalkanoate synthesis regulator phasin